MLSACQLKRRYWIPLAILTVVLALLLGRELMWWLGLGVEMAKHCNTQERLCP
jgi:hypothetical protein